mgnify:CR=1 FL=1
MFDLSQTSRLGYGWVHFAPFLFSLGIMFCPFDLFAKHSRLFFLQQLVKVFAAPFVKVLPAAVLHSLCNSLV